MELYCLGRARVRSDSDLVIRVTLMQQKAWISWFFQIECKSLLRVTLKFPKFELLSNVLIITLKVIILRNPCSGILARQQVCKFANKHLPP